MEIIKWTSWFVCGSIAAVVSYKRWNNGPLLAKNIGAEMLIFIWGWIDLFFVALMYIVEKYSLYRILKKQKKQNDNLLLK